MHLLIVFCSIIVLNTSAANCQLLPPTLLLNIPTNFELFIFEKVLQLQRLINSLNNDTALATSKCLEDVNHFISAVPRGEMWALKMLDAFAKPQSGLFTGNIMHIGNYDECINAEDSNNEINGKYCTVTAELTRSIYKNLLQTANDTIEQLDTDSNVEESLMFRDYLSNLRSSFGICIPSSCNSSHLHKLWAHLNNEFEMDFFEGKRIFFNDDYCLDKNSNVLTVEAIVAIGVLAVFGTVLVLSTLYDIVMMKYKRETGSNILLAFSLYSNAKKLFSKSTSPDNQLGCMNGLRVISMMWIILMHRIAMNSFLPFINAVDILELKEKYYAMPMFASHFSVDTFFVISGILLSYTYLNKRDKSSDNWPYFYLHRYLRLTPSLAAVVLVTATLTRHLGDGPLFPIIDNNFQKPCATSWWVDFLYLQNYIEVNNRCVAQSWYLAVDMQLYVLSPILLIPLIKFPKIAIFFSILLTIFSVGLNFGINYIYKYSANFFDQDDNYQNDMYIPTHTRFGPWLIGVIFGYILFKCKHKKIKINKATVILLWTLSFATTLTIIFSNKYFLNNPFDRVLNSLYNGASRQFWGLSICWIIFACTHGYGGILNKFLSLPIFNITIRINYAMYLVHFGMLAILIGRTRISGYFDIFGLCHLFYGDLFLAFFISVLWTLAFESPIVMLEKIVLKKIANKKNGGKGISQDSTISVIINNDDKIR